MTQVSASAGRTGYELTAPPTPPIARPSRLLLGIYHDIGLAAVALGLGLPVEELDSELGEAVKRGARYIHLMPRMAARAP